ncbi:MAG: SipW-dependent-type signal peptide-containing protein [Eubacteriales bacterium]|nr:SipW-dependent-type signal peptide-containing protein [Eubacteriales bacterium]
MTRSSITKKALFISTCALLFSMLMMAGSTFAWFTDSVSTGSNKITTGSLKVELLHTNAKVTKEEAVTQSTLLFTDKNGEAISWEPGAVAYENFTVKNDGDLALNYRLALDLNNANTIKGTNGKSLKDVLKVKVVKGGVTASDVTENSLKTAEGFAAVAGDQLNILEKAAGNGTQKLAKSTSSAVYGVILYWQPNAETDYQYNLANYPDKDPDGKSVDKTSDGKDRLSIDLGISLGATQAMEESDSSGNDYDREATYPAGNASELKNALNDDTITTIELTGNIALNGDLTVNKDVTIKSVGGAVISGGALDIGSNSNVTLKNITFRSPRTSDNKGVSLKADNYSGNLVVDGCRFEEPQWSSIEITVNAAAKASISITDCTFAVPEASGSAGHKYDSKKCKIQNADARVAASDQKLAAGAHRVLCINGAETTKLVLTGNTFTGLKNCDAAAAVEISGIADAKIADNEVDANDDTAKIKVGQNISPKGFSKK